MANAVGSLLYSTYLVSRPVLPIALDAVTQFVVAKIVQTQRIQGNKAGTLVGLATLILISRDFGKTANCLTCGGYVIFKCSLQFVRSQFDQVDAASEAHDQSKRRLEVEQHRNQYTNFILKALWGYEKKGKGKNQLDS